MKKLSRRLYKEDVRDVCIKHNYYTAGDCEEYEQMFKMLDWESPLSKSNISTFRLEMIANDIKEHSITDDTLDDIMETLAVHIRTVLIDLDD